MAIKKSSKGGNKRQAVKDLSPRARQDRDVKGGRTGSTTLDQKRDLRG